MKNNILRIETKHLYKKKDCSRSNKFVRIRTKNIKQKNEKKDEKANRVLRN